MRILVAHLLLLSGAQAFVPSQQQRHFGASSICKSPTAREFGVDPSVFHDIPQHLSNIQDALTSISLSDAADAAATAAPAASNNGWFGFLEGPIEGLLQIIHSALVAVGVSADAWGVTIIAMTILIKAVTFPLTKTQLESTTKMQQMQPAIKELQAKYQSNPEVMNQKIAEFYQTNNINPLAGCLPSFLQIPIFIGLYRAVLTLAKDDKLNEPFLWLPDLEGPTYGADPTHASDWILKGWTAAGPSLGWDDTISFLILPVLLVASQYASMQLMQPKTDDPAQQQSNAILKVLPLMIGWFSLSVPSALCVYWFTNNIVTTATSIFIRNSLSTEPMTVGASSSSTAAPAAEPQQTIFAPPREKPSGFAAPTYSANDVKPLTAMDAEIVADSEGQEEEEGEPVLEEASTKRQKKRGGKKKGKKSN